jgi:hypothetical protein
MYSGKDGKIPSGPIVTELCYDASELPLQGLYASRVRSRGGCGGRRVTTLRSMVLPLIPSGGLSPILHRAIAGGRRTPLAHAQLARLPPPCHRRTGA